MKLNFIVTFVLIIFLVALLKKNTEGFKVDKYNYILLTKNWKNIYSNIKFNNKSIYLLDDKYQSYLMSKKLNIPTPKLYYCGEYNLMNKNILNKNQFVIKTLKDSSSNNVYPVIKESNNYKNVFNNKIVKISTFDKIYNNKKVIVEEFIKDNNGKYSIPDDYKFYCFKGVPEILHYRSKKPNEDEYIHNYYNIDWNLLKIHLRKYEKGIKIDKPKNFEKMKSYCKKIASTVFPEVFVRIDFYLNNNEPVFGEVTPNPCAGTCFTNEGKKYLDKLCEKHDLSINNYKIFK